MIGRAWPPFQRGDGVLHASSEFVSTAASKACGVPSDSALETTRGEVARVMSMPSERESPPLAASAWIQVSRYRCLGTADLTGNRAYKGPAHRTNRKLKWGEHS